MEPESVTIRMNALKLFPEDQFGPSRDWKSQWSDRMIID